MTRFPNRFSLLVLAGALLVMFHRLLFGEVFFWGLPALQFVPWRDAALDLIRQGQLPLWTPYNGAGAPLLANYQSALLYPPSWLTFILPMAWSMSVVAVLHLFIAGVGMWAFTGRLGALPLGRGMSALAFGLTAYLVGRLGTYPIVTAAAWLPWLLWAAHGFLASGRLRAGAWLALFAGLQLLAGHAQTAWYSLLLVALYAAWCALLSPLRVQVEIKTRLKRLIVVGALLALGAGIAALQLLPTAELLSTSHRSEGVDYDFAMNFSYGPARILNLISPHVFGTPADGTYVERGYFFEYAVYIGLIPLISALAAVVGWLRALRKPEHEPVYASVLFWLAVVLVGFVFALGNFTPIFPFLYRNIPTFDLFQAPVRWHLWTVVGLSVLAGIGVSAWGRTYKTRRWTRRLLVASLGLAAVAVVMAFMLRAAPGAALLARALLATGILGALACWLTLRQPERDGRGYGRWAALVLVIVAADLTWGSWGLNPTVPAAFFDALPDRSEGYARGYWPEAAEETVKFEQYLRVDDYRVATDAWRELRESELPNLNLLDRLYLLNNFDPLLVGHFDAYLTLIEENGIDAELLRGAGVGWVYDENGARQPLNEPSARVWFSRDVCWHESEAALVGALTDAPPGSIHILGDGGCDAGTSPAELPPDALLVSDQGNRVQIEIRAPFDGWLLLADTDYPGWSAAVDGEDVPIYRANLAFRAVQVPPGEHVVTFDYQPGWLLPGLLVTILSIIVTLVLFQLKQREVSDHA